MSHRAGRVLPEAGGRLLRSLGRSPGGPSEDLTGQNRKEGESISSGNAFLRDRQATRWKRGVPAETHAFKCPWSREL